ncbi:hypothetical protein ACJ73_10175 [Blastomyces percursus]|uniref:Uncharacterized protein n=1 Tax=Blastomyces percursus TaxID=1658174 RepID=A0A1J9P1C5_9EURO|nr:hypothetical protein ACJ73_10175 [Blastomyces percursus]
MLMATDIQQPRLQIKRSNTARGSVDGSEINEAAAREVVRRHPFGDSAGAGRKGGESRVRRHRLLQGEGAVHSGASARARKRERKRMRERKNEEERVVWLL